ncbi:MAG: phosphate ABC transporter, permease protein PstA, partial [Pseudomonadales bacterium]
MTTNKDLVTSQRLRQRQAKATFFKYFCIAVTGSAVLILGILLYQIISDGYRWVDWQFMTSYPSRFPEKAGILSALVGTLWLVSLTALLAIPTGVLAAIYLEEYAPKNRWTQLIEVNIANLAGVPSIVFGILGLALFVRFMGLNRSVIAG